MGGTSVAHYFETVAGYLHWQRGDREKAEQLFARSFELNGKNRTEAGEKASPYRFYDIALVYATRGEKEEAYLWLQKAIDAGWRWYDIASKDPMWSDFHDEKRFQQMMGEVKAKVDVMRSRVREMEKEWESAPR